MKKTKDSHYLERHADIKKQDVVETDEFVIIDGHKVNFVTAFDYEKITDNSYEVTLKFIAKSVRD